MSFPAPLKMVRNWRQYAVAQAASANFLTVGTSTISGILVAQLLGAEGRGLYAAIMAWFALAQVLGELGQSGAVTYWVARKPNERSNYVVSARLLMMAVGTVVATVGIIVSSFLAEGVESVEIAYKIAFAGCFLNSICASMVYALQATSFARWNVTRVSQPIAYLLLVGSLAVGGLLDLIWLSVALVGSIAAQFVVVIYQGAKAGLLGGKPSKAHVTQLGKYGFAYSGSVVPATLSTQYDRLILSRMAAPSELGQYAVAGTVAGLASPISTAIASVVFPQTSSGSIDERQRRRLERRAILTAVLAIFLMACVISFLGAPLIPLVFGGDFASAVELVWWLMPALFFRSLYQVVSALLRGRRRPGLVTYGQVCGLLVGAVVIFPLTTWMGIRGAALATGLGELFVLLVTSVMLLSARRSAMKLASARGGNVEAQEFSPVEGEPNDLKGQTREGNSSHH